MTNAILSPYISYLNDILVDYFSKLDLGRDIVVDVVDDPHLLEEGALPYNQCKVYNNFVQ